MKIYLLFTILSCTLTLMGCRYETYPSQWNESLITQINPEITTWFESRQGELIFGRIGEIRMDQDGNFYISDLIKQNIKKFERDGAFQMEIGQRGRSKGEFMNIKSFSIIPDNKETEQLMVLDHVNRLITAYSIKGDFITAHNPPIKTVFPRGQFQAIHIDGSLKHLFLYKLFEGAPGENCIFHLFNDDFTSKLQCFGDFRNLRYHYSETFNHLTQAIPGSMVIDNSLTIYYSPRAYDGAIYKYTYNPKIQSWTFSGELNGLVHHTKPYVENAEPSDYRLAYRGSRMYGQLLNLSLGMFETSSGRFLIHFTWVTTPEGEGWFGMEKFNQNGELEQYYKFFEIGIDENDHWPDVLYRDDEGYVYFANNHELPVIYRMNF
ncbi:MAG: 6-bladed beta-propeller [Cyclonatronaceae bacterium]